MPYISHQQRIELRRVVRQAQRLAGPRGFPAFWNAVANRIRQTSPFAFPENWRACLEIDPAAAAPSASLETLVHDAPDPIWQTDDAPGWSYQYWREDEKAAIAAAGGKIGPQQLPPVTQLFSEPFMIDFLLDNTIGSWWAGRQASAGVRDAGSEKQHRERMGMDSARFRFLRFIATGSGWQTAAGKDGAEPSSLADLTILDPCCGTGFFLIAALRRLVQLRLENDAPDMRAAIAATVRENLFGLEIDPLCTSIARASLMLVCWRMLGAGDGTLPAPQIRCCGKSTDSGLELGQWERNDRGDGIAPFTQLDNADLFGSLVEPEAWTEAERKRCRDVLHREPELDAALTYLKRRYWLVATNVPFLGRGKQHPLLAEYCRQRYPDARRDLACCFVRRCLDLTQPGGFAALVAPQNILFLTSYKGLRQRLLGDYDWRMAARLGERAFTSGAAAGAFSMLAIIRNRRPEPGSSIWMLENCGSAMDNAAASLADAAGQTVPHAALLANPDARILSGQRGDTASALFSGPLLEQYADSRVGVQTGDDARFIRYFWELDWPNQQWQPVQSTPETAHEFAGTHSLIHWHSELLQSSGARIQGLDACGKPGVAVHRLRSIFAYHYTGGIFHQNIAVISAKRLEDAAALWSFIVSPDYTEAVRKLDPKLNITNATLAKTAFDAEKWRAIGKKRYPHGLPLPYGDLPTQLHFHGHPCGTTRWDADSGRVVQNGKRIDETVLHIAAARLAGYRWPAETTTLPMAEAQQGWLDQTKALPHHNAGEGVLRLSLLDGKPEPGALLRNLLRDAYGADWNSGVESALLAAGGSRDFSAWFRERFFIGHCKLFRQRPFLWHIWDGLRDGFAVVADCRRLNRARLEGIIENDVSAWIAAHKRSHKRIAAAEQKIAAAEQLRRKLGLILAGEPPCDIFIRWKPPAMQPRGWEPDAADGVRLNIRPFVLAGDVKYKGAGVLRSRPKIDWKNDRGRDCETEPWFNTFAGKRVNNHHLPSNRKG